MLKANNSQVKFVDATMTKTGIKQFCCSCLKGLNHLSNLGVKRVFSMESLSCQTTCKSHLYLASHLPTSFLKILLNCGESQQGSVWDSQEGAKLACIRKLPRELLHHTAQGRQALNLHLGGCQERKWTETPLVCGQA